MIRFKPRILLTILILILVLGVVYVVMKNLRNSQKPTSAPDASTLAADAEISGELAQFESSSSASPRSSLIKDYIYPRSQVKKQTDSSLELESEASAGEITTWYKDKIRALNFNAKAFAQTSTNGSILNKLSAAKPGEKIEITIKKDQNQSKVVITVDRT